LWYLSDLQLRGIGIKYQLLHDLRYFHKLLPVIT